MDTYFKNLYKNNTGLSHDDRKRLVLSTGGMLVFDPLFSNKDVQAGLLANILDQYKWIWLRLDDGTDIVVNDVEVKQGAVNTWVQYYDPKQGEMARILFSELVKKIDPVNAAESVIRLVQPAGEGRKIYSNYTNVSQIINHNLPIDLGNKRAYADQYREVENKLLNLKASITSDPLIALEQICFLLVECYKEMTINRNARADIKWAKDNFTPGIHYFFDYSEAKTIVDRYIGYLDFHFYPNIGWFHTYVIDAFLQLAFSLFHQACQACNVEVFSDTMMTKAPKYKEILRNFIDRVNKELSGVDEYTQARIKITRIEKTNFGYDGVSEYAHGNPSKIARMPVEVLGQSFTTENTAPREKEVYHGQTFASRMKQADFMVNTHLLLSAFETVGLPNLKNLDVYNLMEIKKRLFHPLLLELAGSFNGDMVLLKKLDDSVTEEWQFINLFMNYYQEYLDAFTAYVSIEVIDPAKLGQQNHYIKQRLPLTLDGRLTMDCMVYAMLHAYIMADILKDLFSLGSYYVIMPFHIGMITVRNIDNTLLSNNKEAWSFQNGTTHRYDIDEEFSSKIIARKTCPPLPPGTVEGWEFFAELASMHFQGMVSLDLPFKVREVIPGSSPEDGLWTQARQQLSGISLFKTGYDQTNEGKKNIYRYLEYYTALKAFHNNEKLVLWNQLAPSLLADYNKDGDLDRYKTRFMAELELTWEKFEKNILLPFKTTIGDKQLDDRNGIFDSGTGIYYTVTHALFTDCNKDKIRTGLDLLNHLTIQNEEMMDIYEHLQHLTKDDLVKPFYIEHKLYPDY